MRLANRSGRVIALARLLLALFFLLSSAQTIDGPIEHPRSMLAITAAFIVYALVLVALTWRNWWLEHKLAAPSHVIDVALFFALDLAAGMPVNSPFFVYFIYLVLAAAARWGWRVAMRTAVVATLLFVGEHLLEGYLEAEDSGGFPFGFMRGAHLVVLALMMSWFGMTHLSGGFGRTCAFSEIRPGEDPILRALTYFANSLRGRWAAMIWTEPDEPWITFACWAKHDGLRIERFPPNEFDWLIASEAGRSPFLFQKVGRGGRPEVGTIDVDVGRT